jgi:diguanylate cyclase (GGDEF)-like protein
MPTDPVLPSRRMPWLYRLNSASPRRVLALSLALLVLIGLLDYLIGIEISLTFFYLFPIALLAWFLGWRWGALGGFVAGVVWLGVNLTGGLYFSQPIIYIWNSLMRLATNEMVAYLFYQLSQVVREEQRLARTDFLTGALNSRAFYELLPVEISRARRTGRPLSLAYIDLDNFKMVNDRLGHLAGDRLLQAVAHTVRGVSRAHDTLARLGGDEFALLLPETGPAEARPAVEKVRAQLSAAMRAGQWPVTFSMGVVVCPAAPPAADELVRAADNLMYTVKHDSKDSVRFEDYQGPAPEPAAARVPREIPPSSAMLAR